MKPNFHVLYNIYYYPQRVQRMSVFCPFYIYSTKYHSLPVSVHTNIHIYVRHMKLIILFCIYPTRDGKTFQSDRVPGVIDGVDHPHIIFYIMSFWEVDTLRIRSTRSSGQLYYTRVCLFTISSCLLCPSGLCPNTMNSNPEGHV